jgi:hypothetical protein
LPTKAHFSSNWTSRVFGGKSHEFVVELSGVLAGQEAVSNHRVLVHPDQPTGLSDPTPLGDVGQDRHHLGFGQPCVEQWCPFSLGEPSLAGLAVQQPTLMAAVSRANGQVAPPPYPVVGTVRILAAEPRQVVCVHRSSGKSRRMRIAVQLV